MHALLRLANVVSPSASRVMRGSGEEAQQTKITQTRTRTYERQAKQHTHGRHYQ